MRKFLWFCFLGAGAIASGSTAQTHPLLFPDHRSENVNPDTYLSVTFPEEPVLHNAGQIRIYDAATGELADMLDMSIPPGIKNTRTLSPYDGFVYADNSNKTYRVNDRDTTWKTEVYQMNYIGGTTEADKYRFYPVTLRDHTAYIHLHGHRLDYDKTYYVEIDKEVFPMDGFEGISGEQWSFATKKTAPSLESSSYIVAADGTGDFTTVQGAVDFIPEDNPVRKTIFIKNGIYEEIVYFRNKQNLIFQGEDREKTLICYANNRVFNSPVISRASLGVRYHNQRAVFAVHNCQRIQISDLTIRSLGEEPAQAEALLTQGQEIVVSNVAIEGSGDALQATGTIYLTDCKIQGFGDNVLGYGAVFFNRCDFVSTYGPHLWVRNPDGKHGNVLLECTLRTIGDVETTIARAPDSNGQSYPYVEAVLIDCKLEGIVPEGWGKVHEVTDNIRYWEYNSTYLENGQPVDVSNRNPASRQLSMETDAELIDNYRNPAYILDGWNPIVERPVFPSSQQ